MHVLIHMALPYSQTVNPIFQWIKTLSWLATASNCINEWPWVAQWTCPTVLYLLVTKRKEFKPGIELYRPLWVEGSCNLCRLSVIHKGIPRRSQKLCSALGVTNKLHLFKWGTKWVIQRHLKELWIIPAFATTSNGVYDILLGEHMIWLVCSTDIWPNAPWMM